MIQVLIIGVIIAFLVWFFFLRKKPEEPPLTIFFQPSDIILNPANRTVETYVLEYLADEPSSPTPSLERNIELGKNIDFNIRWRNGLGFTNAGVKGFIMKRTVDDEPVRVSAIGDKTKLRLMPEEVPNINVGDNQPCEAFIDGKNIDRDIVGSNKFTVFAINEADTEIELGSITVVVTQLQLNKTLKITEVEIITFKPIINPGEFGYDLIQNDSMATFAPETNQDKKFEVTLENRSGINTAIINDGVDSIRKDDEYVISHYLSGAEKKYIFRRDPESGPGKVYIVYKDSRLKEATIEEKDLSPIVLFDDKTVLAGSVAGSRESPTPTR